MIDQSLSVFLFFLLLVCLYHRAISSVVFLNYALTVLVSNVSISMSIDFVLTQPRVPLIAISLQCVPLHLSLKEPKFQFFIGYLHSVSMTLSITLRQSALFFVITILSRTQVVTGRIHVTKTFHLRFIAISRPIKMQFNLPKTVQTNFSLRRLIFFAYLHDMSKYNYRVCKHQME